MSKGFNFFSEVKNKPYQIKTYTMVNNGAEATVESWKFLDIKYNEKVMKKLYGMFKEEFQTSRRLTEKDWQKHWTNIMDKNHKDENAYVDLIKVDGEIIGFVNGQIIECIKSEKPARIHHVKVAVADKRIKDYEGLMRILCFARGFERTDSEVLIVYEAAALVSYLWLWSLELKGSPKYACNSDWIDILKQKIYDKYIPEPKDKNKQKYIEDNYYFYIFEDELVSLSKQKNNVKPSSDFWYKKTELVIAQLVQEDIIKDGYSIVVSVLNTSENFIKFEKMKRKYLANECDASHDNDLSTSGIPQSKF